MNPSASLASTASKVISLFCSRSTRRCSGRCLSLLPLCPSLKPHSSSVAVVRIRRPLRSRAVAGGAVEASATAAAAAAAAAAALAVATMGGEVETAQCEALPSAPTDEDMVARAQEVRRKTAKPHLSSFRVAAVIAYRHREDGSIRFVTGVNTEPCHLGGSICAERVAMGNLQQAGHAGQVLKLAVVTDSDAPLSPGLLCREFLASHLDPETLVVMAGSNDSGGGTAVEATSGDFSGGRGHGSCTVGELWPFPSIYGSTPRAEVVQKGFHFSEKAECIRDIAAQLMLGDSAVQLWEEAHKATEGDVRDALHPIRYAAAALYEDGKIESAHMMKATEYGGTVDPLVALAGHMQKRKREEAALPTLVVVVDQFGSCHAPSAAGRTLLSEHGFGEAQVMVHDRYGRLRVVRARELVPAVGQHLHEGDFD